MVWRLIDDNCLMIQGIQLTAEQKSAEQKRKGSNSCASETGSNPIYVTKEDQPSVDD